MDVDFVSFRPPDDAVFQHLLEQAVAGQVPVYGIVVDVALLVPFAADHRPEGTAEGRSIVQSMIGAWQKGQRFQPWVYPRAGRFVISDDYMILAMAKAGGLETIGCQCLGEPDRTTVLDCQGPLGNEYVRRTLGIG